MKYLVGMSGGIDSSVTAAKLKKAGHDVIGLHMSFWSEEGCTNRCCSAEDMKWAKQVTESFDIPFHLINLRDEFYKQVVQKAFLVPYEQGSTPNPCVTCNRVLRFSVLLEKAKELGADKVCTGHYSILEESGEKKRLKRGVDPEKDQSYFLHRLTQKQLRNIDFPLGEFKKDEVKKLAEEWGLVNPKRKKLESQDLCFIPEKTVEPFLKRNLDNKFWREGDIVSRDGKKVGKHRGLPFYTLGQRKGLHIGGLEEPLYVIGKNTEKNELIVGEQDESKTSHITLNNLNLIEDEIDESKTYQIQYRYQGGLCPGKIRRTSKPYNDTRGNLWDAEVELKEAEAEITPGQFVVIYDGDYCLGGGEIV
jgi:tRNA-specific 2-thiouridylase